MPWVLYPAPHTLGVVLHACGLQHLRERQRSGVQGDPWHMRPCLKITKRYLCLGPALCLFPVAAIISGHKHYYLIVRQSLVKKTCASSSGRNPPSKEQMERDETGVHVFRPPNTQNTHVYAYTHVHMFTQTHKVRHVGANQ